MLAGDAILHRRRPLEALRKHARLYVPIAAICILGLIVVGRILLESKTAGFSIPGLGPAEYFWTQVRVWYLYLGLFLLPVAQNADYDIPLSATPWEYGAWLAAAGLALALFGAWRIRVRFPLVWLGAVLFALLLAPTSSLVPIQDVAAERRMYLPVLGLLLIACDLLRRLRFGLVEFGLLGAVLATCALVTHHRSRVWGDDVLLWSDVVRKSPAKLRGYTHLTFAHIRVGHCADAVARAAEFPARVQTSPEFLGAWASALECAGRPEDAIENYRRAALLAPGVGTYLKLALAYRRTGQKADAESVASQALRMQPRTAFDRSVMAFYLSSQEQTRARTP